MGEVESGAIDAPSSGLQLLRKKCVSSLPVRDGPELVFSDEMCRQLVAMLGYCAIPVGNECVLSTMIKF